MAYVVTAAVSLGLGALVAWLALRRSTIQTTGAPTDSSAAVTAAGAVVLEAAQTKAHEVTNAPDAALVAELERLRARGRAGK